MFLKRLEIQGFKSFAEKTEIEFQGGITGVVGPNGSGKSNISDSLRWVLGEQSVKTLRGSKMEDVIFSGTAKRKPLGFAEVTLVLDNKDGSLPIDYSEVCVTRRVFRSGESEYYINKNSCRLKDIRELFMDTGVGKEGYSIIGQGRIDDILSTKSEDRRNIFEEAAGIVKYKSRKEEAEKKLEKTKENLIRINDIISELEKQLEPLKQQSEKAREYLKLSDILKNLEVNLFIRDIDRLREEITHIEAQKTLVIEQLKFNEEKRNELENKYNKVKFEIDKMEETIENIQNSKYSIQSKIEKNESELNLSSEKIVFLEREAERNEAEIDRFHEQIKAISIQKDKTKDYKQDLEAKIDKLDQELALKTADLDKLTKDIESKEKHIEEKKGDLIQFLNMMSDKKSKINSLMSFNQSIEKRISQIQDEIDELNEQEKCNKDNISNIDREIVSLKQALSKSNIDKAEKIKSRESLANQLDSTQSNLDSIKAKLQGKASNYKLLKEMKEEYEGYYKSVKNVLLACKNNRVLGNGVKGVVAELLNVDKDYERAIEVALGSSVQNIVTETQENAKNIINYLKKNNLGRVTFLPISSVNSRGLSTNERKLIEENGALGVASELVTFDIEYKGIFEYLLGRVVVVNSIDDGIKISKISKHSFKIVSLDGDILNPGGSMTGGSYNNTTNLLGRERQIKDLEDCIESLNSEQAIKLRKINDIRQQLHKLDVSLSEIEDNINAFNVKLAKLENTLGQYKENGKKNINLINRYMQEKVQLTSESNDSKTNIKALEEDLNKLRTQNDLTQDTIDEQVKYFEQQKIQKDTLQNANVEVRVKIASFQQELKSLASTINRLDDEKSKILKDISAKQIDKDKSLIEINSIKENVLVLNENKRNYNEELLEYDIKLNELKTDKNNFMQAFYTEQEKLNDMNRKMNELQKSINALEVKHEKYNIQLENINTRMWEDYEMTYQMAVRFKQDIENITKTQNEIKSLKNSIKSLGNINIDAIDEYEKVDERYNFMKMQKDDLIEAKDSLNGVIKDMDVKMKEQFMESFTIIKKYFSEVFIKLFGGGKADVFLQDEENILTSGIEIIAQPPGKKLQSLSLLSGGERALTAIALLFAILKTKPTPFCILDEIEAALDDANVYRYAEYLKEFSSQTQFIVITHRKGTMESVDSLYGITMEEEGISKLVSVKLSEKLEEKAS
ncbi:chromosome segregation protein SMC [Brassicibacter mesophilus]|uniref:chromosome segregation protein SMC n=1 Tax=Brassicibacter mesophilus TaxID=745119 RepID=UPI003D24EAA6